MTARTNTIGIMIEQFLILIASMPWYTAVVGLWQQSEVSHLLSCQAASVHSEVVWFTGGEKVTVEGNCTEGKNVPGRAL
jgi:hypothetical protein